MPEFDPDKYVAEEAIDEQGFDPDSYLTETVKKKDETVSGKELDSTEVESTSTLPSENELIKTAELEGDQIPPLSLQETATLEETPKEAKPDIPLSVQEFQDKVQDTVEWHEATKDERRALMEKADEEFAKQTAQRVDLLSKEIDDKSKEAYDELEYNRAQLAQNLSDTKGLYDLSKQDPSYKEDFKQVSQESKALHALVKESEAKTNALADAKELVIKAKKYYDTKDAGVLDALFNSQYGKDFISFGFNEAFRGYDILKIIEKPEAERTEEENIALEAYALNDQLMATNEQSISSMIGSGAAATIPFMVEFAASGGFSTAAKAGVKRSITKIIKDQLKKKGKKTIAAKALMKSKPLISGAVGAAVRVPLLTSELLPTTPTRMIGDLTLKQTPEGEKIVREGEEDFQTAFGKSLATTYLSASVEALGGPISKTAGKFKKSFLTNTVPGVKIARLSENIAKKLPTIPGANTKMARMGKKMFEQAGVQNMFAETSEEIIEAYGHAAVTGDRKLSEVWDNKQMLAILGTVAVIGGTRLGTDMAFRQAFDQRLVAKRNLKNAAKNLKPETILEIDKILKGDNGDNNAAQMDLYLQQKNIDGASREDFKNILNYYSNKLYVNSMDQSQAIIEEPLTPEETKKMQESRAEEGPMEAEVTTEEKVPTTAPKTTVEAEIEVEPKIQEDEKIMQDEGQEQIDEDVRQEITERQEKDGYIGEEEVLIEEPVTEEFAALQKEVADREVQVKAAKTETLPGTDIPRKVKRLGDIEGHSTHVAISDNNAIIEGALDQSPETVQELTFKKDAQIADVSKPEVVKVLKANAMERAWSKKDKKAIKNWKPDSKYSADVDYNRLIEQAAERLGFDGMTQFDVTDYDKPTAVNVWNLEAFEGIETTIDEIIDRAAERSTNPSELYNLFAQEGNLYDELLPWQQMLLDNYVFTEKSIQDVLGLTKEEGEVKGWYETAKRKGSNIRDAATEINNNLESAGMASNITTDDVVTFMQQYPLPNEIQKYSENQSKLAAKFYDLVRKKYGIRSFKSKQDLKTKTENKEFSDFINRTVGDFSTFEEINNAVEDNKETLTPKQYKLFKQKIEDGKEATRKYEQAFEDGGKEATDLRTTDGVRDVEGSPTTKKKESRPRVEQKKKPQKPKPDAKEQQSRKVRVEGDTKKGESVSDKDMPKLDRPELQDRPEVEKPKEKVAKTKEEKIAAARSIEELNSLLASQEVSIRDKAYMKRMEELRKQGYYTNDDLPEEIRKTTGLQETIDYNKSIEDHFKSDPAVKSAGFSFNVETRGPTPEELFRKYLSKEGLLPKNIYDRWMKTQGRINSHVEGAQFLIKDFNKALKAAYGKTRLGTPKVTDVELERINDILQRLGKDKIDRTEVLNELPEKMREPVSRMRDLIDAMSTELAHSGLIEGDLVAKIQDNLGFYMTRTYKVHHDKKWKWENIPDEIKIRAAKVIKDAITRQGLTNFSNSLNDIEDIPSRNKIKKAFELDELGNTELDLVQIEAVAKELASDETIPKNIRDRLTNYIVQSNDEVEGKMREMVNSADWAGGGKTTLGAKDLGVLKKRKDIPIEIRELLGEYKDPAYNFFTSIAKMANLIERHKFLESAKVQGMGLWLHSKPKGDFSVKIAGDTSPTLAPLNGLYTSQDIVDAFKKPGMESVPSWLRFYITGVGYAKYAKTIASPVTHVRNFWSNFGFQAANGRIDFSKGGKTIRTVIDKIKNKDSQEFRDYYQRLIELNVVGESVSANELKKILADSFLYQSDFSADANTVFKRNKWKKPLQKLEKAYQMEDDIHKIYAFEVEKGRYKKVFEKIHQDKTAEEVNDLAEEKAAEIVRATMPTYSELPRLVQSLNRFPITGTFVSFPAEVIRTTWNTGRLAHKEMADPATRSIGIKRMTGFVLTGALTGTVAIASRMLLGQDADDEEDFKRFLAPWSKQSDIIMVADLGGGKYTYIDLGFSDPHNYIKKAANALQSSFRGEDVGKSIREAIWQLLEPFMGLDMLTGRLIDVSSNKQAQNGRAVYNTADEPGDQFIDALNYVLEGFEPGAVSTGKRIDRAYRNKINEFGATSTPMNEIVGVLAGQKIQTLEIGKSYYFKAKDSGDKINQALYIYKNEMYNEKKGYRTNLDKAHRRANKVLREHLKEARKNYLAALNLGVPEKELRRTTFEMKVGVRSQKRITKAILTGEFPIIDKESGRLTFD